MEFRILGPLQVVDGQAPVEIAGTKRKALLALLVLRANEVVRTDWLIDQLWGERAPRNAAAALHNHVSRLRKALGPEMVARRDWGYVLRAAPGSIDLQRFEALLAESDPMAARERSEKLRDALGLWRGLPLADLSLEPALQRDIARLEELRLSTLERRMDADLESGRSTELVGELEVLITENPLREHLRWQLILALYRGGRQAEALEVYRETRRVLADELGLDPSPALRELERAILRQDPSLVVPVPILPSEPFVAPGPGGRSKVYAGLVALVLLGGAGVAAAMMLSGGERSRTAAPAEAVRTIVQTVRTMTEHPASTAKRPTRDTRAARKSRAKATSTATRSGTVARHVTHSRVIVVRRTRATHATHVTVRAQHTKRQTGTTRTVVTKPDAVRIADDFERPAVDPRTWWPGGFGTGATADQSNGRLVLAIPANAEVDAQYSTVSASDSLQCRFLGDFDARVDYTLVDWPSANGASASMTAATPEWTWVLSRSGSVYSSWPDGNSAPSTDTSGSLRIARSHNLMTTYFWRGTQWRKLGVTNLRGEVRLRLELSATAAGWQHTAVSAAFDNFVVAAPEADCPS